MFIKNLKKFINYYGEGRKLKLIGFSLLSLCAGLLEFIGIALIYPFILMIINPSLLENTGLFDKYLPILNNSNTLKSSLIIGFCVLAVFIFKNIFIIFSLAMQTQFISNWRRDLSKRFMEYYLWAPYDEMIKTPPSHKIYTITTLCSQSVELFMIRCLNLLTNTAVVGMIVLLLLWKFPIAAAATIIFISICLSLQNKYFKKRAQELSEKMVTSTKEYNEILISNTENLKEIKILSAEPYFTKEFDNIADTSAVYYFQFNYFNAIPPYIVEILIVCSLLILGGIISVQNINNSATIIASFAVIAASIFRIAPALNRIQSSIININAGRNYVIALNQEYEKCNLKTFKYNKNISKNRVDFFRKIELKNINYSYDGKTDVLKNISFEINKGDFIGIIGLSGAGKSTLADIILGLLTPHSGEILVDNTKLNENNFSEFRKLIGYVPQQINVIEKSFKENVAWGIDYEKIDEDGVIKALKASQLYDLVEKFDEGINAKPFIGSTGLSQGQKQRLAIARALYRDPELLILDEATSSLDVKVENEITSMLNNLKENKTIIAIAHRLSTLKACTKLIYMKDGKIVDIGTFEELCGRYKDFETLVKLSSIK